MKQIYNFEQVQPPVLNENMIRKEIENRRLRLQTVMLALAGILLLIVIILLGFFVYKNNPWITLCCFIYVMISSTGSGIMAVVFTRKGGFFV